MENYEQLATLVKALGHPIRLQIVAMLCAEGEVCVCHIEHHMGYRQAYISQHLSRLREAGLVKDRREGINVFYSLATETVGLILAVADQIASSLPDDEQTIRRYQPMNTNVSSCHCPKCQTAACISASSIEGAT